MQVNLAPVLRNTGLLNSADRLAVAVLQGLNTSAVPTPTVQEQRREQEQQRVADTSSSTADVMRQAERRLDPSSRGWKRDQVRSAARENQMSSGRRAFQRALTDAKGSGGERTSETSAPRAEFTRETQQNASDDRAARPTPAVDANAAKTPTTNRVAQRDPSTSNEPPSSPRRAARTEQLLSPAGVRQAAPPAILGNLASEATGTVKGAASGVVRSIVEGKPSGPATVATGDGRSPAKTARVIGQRPPGSRPAQTADREANIERVLRTIHSRIGRQRSTAIVRLDPPELGSLRLHMDLRDNVLTLRVDTQTDVAQRLLTEELASLRRGLESAGLHLERVEIRPPDPAPDGAGESPPQASDHGGADGETSGEANAERSQHGWSGIDRHIGTEAGAESGWSSHAAAEETSPAAESLVNVLA